MIRKLYILTKRWWRTTLYLKKWKPQVPLEPITLDKWKPKKEQVLPEEITKGISLKKVPSSKRVVKKGPAKKKKASDTPFVSKEEITILADYTSPRLSRKKGKK